MRPSPRHTHARTVVALILVCGAVSACSAGDRIQSAVRERTVGAAEESVPAKVFHSSGLICDGPLMSAETFELPEDGTGPATIERALDQFWAGAPDVRAGLRETVVGPRVRYDYGDGDTKLIVGFIEMNNGWVVGYKTQCEQG